MSGSDALVFGLFPVALSLIGAVVLVFAVRIRGTARRSLAWPTTTGTVRSAAVRAYRTSRPGHNYAPDLAYEYTVAGIAYTGDRIHAGLSSSMSPFNAPSGAEEVLRRYPVGSTVTVAYDPADPTQAMLEPGRGQTAFGILLAAGLVFVFIGLCFGIAILAAYVAEG